MYQQNPISDKRRPLIVKFLEKQMARATAKTTGWDWTTLTPVRKEKVGLFKLVIYRSNIRPADRLEYLLSGGQITREFDSSVPWLTEEEKMMWGETLEDNWDHYKELASEASLLIYVKAEKTADQIAEADPTERGIYALWIARQVAWRHTGSFGGGIGAARAQGSLRFPEDIEKTYQDLELYHDRKERGLIPQEYRDIEKIKDYPALFKLLKEYGGMVSDKEALKLALTKSKTVYESDTYHVLEVKSWQLAKRLAQGTGWCVRGTNQAKHYLSEPDKYPLYFIFKDGKKFALLTNRPDDRQLMDPSNSPINEDWWRDTLVGQPDEEFLDILVTISDWLACKECGEVHWGRSPWIERNRALVSEVYRTLYEGAGFDLTQIPPSSWIVAAIPSPLENFKAQLLRRDPPVPIVADPEKLKKKIVIGPASVILNIEGATFPLIEEFAEKAGFAGPEGEFASGETVSSLLVSPVIKRASCACGKITSWQEGRLLADVLHSLFVMAPCEDFPACGHAPDVSGGAYSCPPTLLDGTQSGMRCPCGAFVPLGSKYSVCPQCLKGDDFGYEDEEPYEEDEEEDDYDGCRIELLQDQSDIMIRSLERLWRTRQYAWESAGVQDLIAQQWNVFADLMDLYREYGDLLSPDAAKSVYDPFRVLNDFYERGWYSEEDFVGYFLPALEHISKTLRKVDHKDCCL